MSDPADIPGRHVPPRATPVQPDKPGSGNRTGTDDDGGASSGETAAERRGSDERPDAGLDNVRGGYGGKSSKDGDDDPAMVPNRPASDAQ